MKPHNGHRIIESLAEELHKQYRAAEKAMNRVKKIWRAPGKQVNNTNRLLHDHGWKACGQRDYFRKRALLIMKRAKTEPTTLFEAEQRFNSEVIERRLRMGINT